MSWIAYQLKEVNTHAAILQEHRGADDPDRILPTCLPDRPLLADKMQRTRYQTAKPHSQPSCCCGQHDGRMAGPSQDTSLQLTADRPAGTSMASCTPG